MGEWLNNVIKVENGTSNKTEFTDAVTHWLGTEVAQFTEGRWEPVARRVVWLFNGGYALSVGTAYSPTFYHLTDLISESDQMPIPQSMQTNWVYTHHANGWRYESGSGSELPSAETIIKLLEMFSKHLGTPSILLPWGYIWTESILDQGEDYYLDWEDDVEEGEDNNHKTMVKMLGLLKDGTLEKASPWEFRFSEDEEAGLSKHCDFMRFERFTKRLSDEKIAVVDLDQHCAGCASGVYEYAVKEDPELEGKEIFRTWGQNSEYCWLGDGAIFFQTYLNDPEGERQIKEAAEAEGLYTGVYEEDWEATGEFEYQS